MLTAAGGPYQPTAVPLFYEIVWRPAVPCTSAFVERLCVPWTPLLAASTMAEKSRKRFQPVYDALDANNFARVVQLCDKRDMAGHPLSQVRRAKRG